MTEKKRNKLINLNANQLNAPIKRLLFPNLIRNKVQPYAAIRAILNYKDIRHFIPYWSQRALF